MAGDALRGRKVLVVEDDALIAMLIEDVLTESGATVQGPIADEATALRAAEDSECDLALLDVHLGRGSSAAVARRLGGRGVPVVFVTGYGRHGLPEPFAGAPMLGKPFRDEELVRMVERVLADG
ncbi:MAG: response regulator [Geminicoccaceae bacterium]